MKKIIFIFLNTLKYFESKFILNSYNNKRIFILILKTLLIFTFFNILILLPAFLISSKIISMIVLISMIFSFLIFCLIYINIRLKNKEKLDKIVINSSIFKADFFNYLKNDIYFNIKFSIFLTLDLFFYSFIIYSIIFIPLKIKFFVYLLILGCFFIIFLIITTLSCLIYHLLKKDKTSFFSKVSARSEFKNKHFIIMFLFIFLSILTFFIFKIFISNYLIIIILTLIISLFLSIILNLLFQKIGVYKKANWLIILRSIKDYFKSFKIKFKQVNLLKQFKNYVFKLLIPFIAFVLFLISSIIINRFFRINIKSALIQSIIFGLFFTYPLINVISKNNVKRNLIKPFNFTILIFSIIFILIFISYFKITISESNLLNQEKTILFSLRSFILPFINILNMMSADINSIIGNINIPLTIFICVSLPFIFLIILSLNTILNSFFNYLGRLIDYNLRKKLTKQNPSILFGDSLSLYPVMFEIVGYCFLLVILWIQIIPISRLFFNLFDLFEVTEVFKFTFLTKNNIESFFNIVFYIILFIIIFKIIHLFIFSLLSHFILFNDEIVYYENKLYKKIILRIPLSRINYIVIKQNILERIFDIGTICVETKDKNGFIKIKGIPSIKEKNILIMDKIKSDI